MQSVYQAPRAVIATALRALVTRKNVSTPNRQALLRCCDLFDSKHMDFPDAYLAAFSEVHGIGAIASFDKGLGKTEGIKRIDPGKLND